MLAVTLDPSERSLRSLPMSLTCFTNTAPEIAETLAGSEGA